MNKADPLAQAAVVDRWPASFNNIAVLPELVPGCVVVDLIAVLGSLFFVVGDIDK